MMTSLMCTEYSGSLHFMYGLVKHFYIAIDSTIWYIGFVVIYKSMCSYRFLILSYYCRMCLVESCKVLLPLVASLDSHQLCSNLNRRNWPPWVFVRKPMEMFPHILYCPQQKRY